MTLPTRCGPARRPRAMSHHAYRRSSGTTSTCAAIWNTESPLVYTIGSPVARCASPSSATISVPDAGTLPSTPCSIADENGPITSSGNPFGYSGNGVSSRTPIISQCPVVVSLPAETSVARPCAVPGSARGTTPSIAVNRPSPRPSSTGASSPPTASATWARVSDPASPYPSASGASPTPHESHTRMHTRETERGTSAGQLLAIDAQRRPRDRVEPFVTDRVPATLA